MTDRIAQQTVWPKYLLLAFVVLAGLAGGLYMATNSSGEAVSPLESAPPTHRFPLSTADAKDSLEAPVAAVDPSGRIYVAWASRSGDDERSLFLIRSDDAGNSFDAPRIISKTGVFKSVSQMKGKTVTRELRMVPHLAVSGQGLHLAWTESRPEIPGVRMVVATSADRGETFGPKMPVHQDSNARPTFTALAIGNDGMLQCSWLDNRNKTQQAYASFRRPGQIEFDAEQVVHAGTDSKGVCPCCPTASLLSPDGVAYVAFRNVDDGYRDIAIGRKRPGQDAFEIFRVVPPTWAFNGCPHDGASMALVGDTLHISWMDARTGSQRCYHAAAKCSDMHFNAHELHSIAQGTQGNAKLHVDRDGRLHAVWEESLGTEPAPAGHKHNHEPAAPTPGSGSGRAVMHAVLKPGDAAFGPAAAVASKPGAFQTRPNVVATPDGHRVIVWNELDERGKAVVVATLPRK